MFDYAHTIALITGASSGLGESFATQLAARGTNVVLVARNLSKLEALAQRLRTEYRVQATVIAADLTDPFAPQKIYEQTRAESLSINLLVNNAGFALAGAFLEHDVQAERNQIEVNITALMTLSHLFGRDMQGRNSGIINVASNAAFQPLAYSAVYAASKSFVLLFSEALGRELRGRGTRVLAVCPGPVKTLFWDKIDSRLSTRMMDTPEPVVKQTLAAFEKGKAVLIPGRLMNRLQAFATRLVPRAVMTAIAEKTSRKIMMAGH
jgi:short-subunit dehydrogenase